MKTGTDDLLDYILARLREGPRLAQDQIQRNGNKFKHRIAFLNLKSMLITFLKAVTKKDF